MNGVTWGGPVYINYMALFLVFHVTGFLQGPSFFSNAGKSYSLRLDGLISRKTFEQTERRGKRRF